MTDLLAASDYTSTGWDTFLRGVDDGTWEWMVTPGASGYGLMPWVSTIDCHCGSHEMAKPHVGHGWAWVTPALVTWRSVFDAGGNYSPDMCHFDPWYPDSMLTGAPVVFITSMVFFEQMDVEGNTRAWNFFVPDHREWRSSLASDGTPFGLAPAWNVTPVDYRYWHDWTADWTEIVAADGVHTSYAVDCNAEHNTYEDEDGEEHQCDPYVLLDNGTCVYDCRCHIDIDRDEALRMQYHNYYSALLNSTTNPDVLDTTWEYAQERLISGWTKVHDLAKEHECFRLLEQQLSPFWESNGPPTWHPITASG